MQSTLERLRSEASALDADQRAQLALDLLQSLDASEPSVDVDKAWDAEAVRRLREFDAGQTVTISAEELHASFDAPSA